MVDHQQLIANYLTTIDNLQIETLDLLKGYHQIEMRAFFLAILKAIHSYYVVTRKTIKKTNVMTRLKMIAPTVKS